MCVCVCVCVCVRACVRACVCVCVCVWGGDGRGVYWSKMEKANVNEFMRDLMVNRIYLKYWDILIPCHAGP